MNEKINEKVECLRPFTKMLMTIGQLPTSYLMSMSYYEQVLWLTKYLQEKVIPALNNNARAVEEIQRIVIDLQNYINNYFDNLDVQEEIDHKIDEMVESGQFESLLQNIINTLRVYDNIEEMKEDTSLVNNQRVYCFGYTTRGDIGNGYYFITDETLTPDDLTIIELDNGLFAKLVYDNEIKVADISVLTTELITYFLNHNIHILCDRLEINSTITISSDNVIIKDTKFFSNNTEIYTLRITGNNVKIENCEFTGNVGNYIRVVNTDNTIITNNTFNGENGQQTTPVVIYNSSNALITNNNFIDCVGFNVQTLISKMVNISNNNFKNTMFKSLYNALGGETSISISIPCNPKRKAVRLNGTILAGVVYNYDSTEHILTITLPDTLSTDDKVAFYGYQSLEPININSNSYDITINNNIIDGSGDSGIVVGSDYHNGELNPSSTTDTDFPRRINISGNSIKNCAYAGIGITRKTRFITISNNTITNCGWNTDDLYCSGVFTPYATPISICNNVIGNIIRSESLYETEDGLMKYGIAITPDGAIDNENSRQYLKLCNSIIIKNNAIKNVGIYIYTVPNGNLHSQAGLICDSDREITLNELNGTIENNNGYHLASSNANIRLDEEDTIDNDSSIKVVFDSASGYAQVNHDSVKNLSNYLVEISFFAKASDDKKLARIYYNSAVGNQVNTIMERLTTEWKFYKMYILIGRQPTTFSFRFSSDGTTGYTLFSHLRYKLKSLNDSAE